jgi:hypothetical protein
MVAHVYTPLSELLDAADLPVHLFLPEAAASLELIYVLSHTVVQTPFGAQLWAEAVINQPLSFGLPILPLSMVVGPTAEGTPAIVRWLLEDEWFFEAEGLPFALRFAPSFLRPTDPAKTYAEIAAQGSVHLEHGTLRHLNPAHAFSLPPSEIAGLGIIVSLENILLDFSDTASPPEILALGFDASFRGMYASSGSLTILPKLERANGGRGITIEATDLAVRSQGVTCTLSHEFFVERLEGAIGEESEAAVNLFSPEWQIALAEVSLELRDSALQAFGATGVLNVPFFDSLLELELSAEVQPNGQGLLYGAKITAAEPGTMTTPLGTVSYETLLLDSLIGDDEFTASGQITGLAVDVEGFPISAALAAVEARHGNGPLGLNIRLEDLQLGDWGSIAIAELAIGEVRPDGRVAHRLVFGIDTPIPLGTTGLVLEHGLLTLEVTTDTDGTGDWRELLGNAKIDLAGLRLTGESVPGGVLAGDLRVVFEDGQLQLDESYLRRDSGNGKPPSTLGIKRLHLSRECVAVVFSDPQINYWFHRVAPNLTDTSEPAVHEISLRVVLGEPIQELRLDWTIEGIDRTKQLPGIQLIVPAQVRVSVLLGGAGRPFSQLAVALTFEQGAELVALSSFAWLRGEDREVLSGESEAPALELRARALRKSTLVLLDWDVEAGKLPKFFRQLASPMAPFNWSAPETLAQLTPFAPIPLRDEDWYFVVHVNLETLPFLRGGEGDDSQFLQLDPARTTYEVRIPEHVIRVDLGLTANIGPMRLETGIPLEFDWETFAFTVPHELGLAILTTQEILQPPEPHLGLTWRFKGVPAKDRTGAVIPGRYHLFTLTTKDHNYSILQAPDALFEVEYTQLSSEGIGFSIADFALTPKGISLTAEVIDRPATLNGLDTRFRFADTQIVIVENRIANFTLKGSGPLPPALVGDATADITLQLAQDDAGKLTLKSGGAQLKGLKKLECKNTRFEFNITAIGVQFVYEGKFHLYFTLTGSALFKLAPGDDTEGALALLPNIKIDLVECPLTGDARVLSKHIKFLIDLPKPISFPFLGAFEMELRAIGFVPQADVFDGDGAMLITGQLKFAQGAGDAADTRNDLHKLYIGLPKPGSIIPRIHFANLPVNLNFGSAFRLNGVVDFVDGALEKGFTGEGTLEIEGLPTFATAFAFLRVRRDPSAPWVRAWFVYAEVRKISVQIPVVTIFLREVGLGFGYRYTLASIKAADQANDAGELIKQLTVLSRTQGDLSRRDRWSVDLEDEGQDPRWTVAFRALLSQTTASPSPLSYKEAEEKELTCLFLLDAVVALRSDLTFLMSARGWLFANYYDYVTNYKGLREKPVMSGFVLLAPRKKRFLAHVASNPGGQFGAQPMPPFLERALANSKFSATLLIEPGLLHTELGWPNQLQWRDKFGVLDAEFRGGFIFRVSRDELVTGVSYLARAGLSIKAELSLGFVGVRVSAEARVAFGGRYIGLLSLRDPLGSSALYGGIGLEVMIRFSVELWLKIKLWRIKITKTWRFSFVLDFTASLEFGVVGISTSGVGLRGQGHLAVAVMGHRFSLSVKLGINEGAVTTALARTQHVLNLGLEATEVEPIPGTTVMSRRARLAATAARALEARSAEPAAEPTLTPIFHAPDYSIFVIRGATDADPSLFVLLPAGERPDGSAEPGFLPVPPQDGLAVTADFQMSIPGGGDPYTLEQYDPSTGTWVARAPGSGGARSFSWKVQWDMPVATGEQQAFDEGGAADGEPTPRSFGLREYLRKAFLVVETDVSEDPEVEPTVTPVGDPTVLPRADAIEDDRVHNPTDAAFEAAVRGAMEQFRGSPYFRRDPNSEYEQLLERAYRDDTTIYSATGTLSALTLDDVLNEQQAHELRGMVIHDLVSDLRDYSTAARAAGTTPPPPAGSIAFAMGLVFRVVGKAPAWLEDAVATGGPTLSQRLAPDAAAPSSDVVRARTFNVRSTDFAVNSPRFERVQQLTDASTIALAWDLVWPEPPAGELNAAQRDPEHHLVNYVVRRRPLDGNDREAIFTVKGADTLHREAASVMKRLRRRFQLVDHFDETPEDLALLPVSGKSYLYSITPVDFSGHAGRPLSLVATRFPTDPPSVPVDGEATVHYVVGAATLDPAAAVPPTAAPPLVAPAALTVRWTEAAASRRGPVIPIGTYQLVFRREPTLPIGSYGLDGSTQRPSEGSLPTTNARPLPTDVKVVILPSGPGDALVAEVAVAELQAAGVLPAGSAPRWRPEAWRIYFQTISLNGVPSSLAPIKVLLRVEAASPDPFDPLDTPSERREERRPAELEWLPAPLRFPLLPPEDQLATLGPVHVPMVAAGSSAAALAFDPTLANVQHRAHPAGLRCVRFRWNQGPSGDAGYPLDLNAGYHLLELDTDAHSTETFSDKALLGKALRFLQDVQMIPADELALTPSNTLAPSQWEAWYPSAALRQTPPGLRAEGSELTAGPWYSWRESILEWPEWAGLTRAVDAGIRDQAHHPALQAILDALAATYNVELQAIPAMQPQNLAAFLKATAPSADPYGWSILQRFGLSVAFRLRARDTGEILQGSALLGALDGALSKVTPAEARHLHVELLFQPGRAIELTERPTEAGGLLALVQLSLRPALRQVRSYGRVALSGQPGTRLELAITLAPGVACSMLDQSDAAAGQLELSAEPAASVVIRRSIQIPIGGRTALLFRGRALPTVELVNQDESTTPLQVEPFAATDEHAAYFSISTDALAAELAGAAPDVASAWTAFARYAESLSSTDPAVPDDQKIRVPRTKDQIAAVIADCTAWMQRFFDHGGGATSAGRPWVATAYPRAGSPAHAAPDAGGRLTYDHLLEDPWAHAFRYYVRPYGRYDRLWQGLRQSPALFPGTPRLDETTPETTGGGLDVVLERVRPVARPLVLSSRRLDPPNTLASPAPPGVTWEVIVAEHPEQTLAAHNQTLARQLAFRQVAYTLLREFAYPVWIEKLGIALAPVPERYPLPPTALPAAPEHLALGGPLTDDDARTLDLPARIGPFQQGALALQWEGLPFYYEHKLLLIAQTARTVSAVNEITQRDFEYRTPDPIAEMDLAVVEWTPQPPFDPSSGALSLNSRIVTVTLRQLWDSLPEAARVRWPGERPDGVRRTPGWVPDLGVVYQIVEQFSGNVEVQAEVYFDEQLGAFTRRQTGKRFLVDVGALTPPQGAGTYSLEIVVQEIARQELSRVYPSDVLAGVSAETLAKLRLGGNVLLFVGPMTHDDLDQLLAAFDPADATALRSMHDAWYAQTAVSEAPAQVPAALADMLDFPDPVELRLMWEGPMSAEEAAALLALPGDDEFRAALARLASVVGDGSGVVSISAPLGPESVPTALRTRVTLARDAGDQVYTALRWSGPLSDADAGALAEWPKIRTLRGAVAALISAANARSYTVAVPPPRPIPEELPPALAQRLDIGDTLLAWHGPAPTDAERAALLALDGDAAFLAARASLLAAIDAEQTVPLGPVAERPTQADLPPELAQLQIDAEQLTWSAPPPAPEQRTALLALPGDQAFRDAVVALLAVLDAGQGNAVPLAAFVARPAQTDLPVALQARLLIGTSTLQWTSPAPTDLERAALVALLGDDAFMAALAVLRSQIDADRSSAMAPYPRRPRQADVPAPFDAQLHITKTVVTWTGQLRTPDARAFLLALTGDPPFTAAVLQIVQELDTQQLEVPFSTQVRPAPDAIGSLAAKLLLGRTVLRFHGLMTRAQVPQIQSLFARATDRRAIDRFYQATQSGGLRGRELRIRSRRGAAPPSALHPIPLKPL